MHNETGALLEVTAVVCMSNEGAVSGEIVTVATRSSPPISHKHILHEGGMSM